MLISANVFKFGSILIVVTIVLIWFVLCMLYQNKSVLMLYYISRRDMFTKDTLNIFCRMQKHVENR